MVGVPVSVDDQLDLERALMCLLNNLLSSASSIYQRRIATLVFPHQVAVSGERAEG
jgi:hypothetical protein